MNLRVVAEGVETLGELSFPRAHQCDEAQGSYFRKKLLSIVTVKIGFRIGANEVGQQTSQIQYLAYRETLSRASTSAALL
jgi:hypothetical protein